MRKYRFKRPFPRVTFPHESSQDYKRVQWGSSLGQRAPAGSWGSGGARPSCPSSPPAMPRGSCPPPLGCLCEGGQWANGVNMETMNLVWRICSYTRTYKQYIWFIPSISASQGSRIIAVPYTLVWSRFMSDRAGLVHPPETANTVKVRQTLITMRVCQKEYRCQFCYIIKQRKWTEIGKQIINQISSLAS